MRVDLRGLTLTLGSGTVFAGIDLTLGPRDRLRLVGPAASGKTVLLETLAGLRRPSGGHILVDGTDLDRVSLSSWRDAAHLVPMELMDATVLENLRMPGRRVAEAEARAVVRLLDLEDAIDRLPGRFEARLHPSGAPLSETHIRRLVLARALLARPRLLMLDRTLDGLGLDTNRLDEVLEYTLGQSAPWAAIVVTDDPRIARWCDAKLQLGSTGQSV